MDLTKLLKQHRAHLLNKVAAIDLLLEVESEVEVDMPKLKPAASSTNGTPKAPRLMGQEPAVLEILRAHRGPMTTVQIAQKMPARFRSSLHKNTMRSRVSSACSRLAHKGDVVQRGRSLYEAVTKR